MSHVSNIRIQRKILKNLRIDSNLPIVNDSYNWNKKTVISSGLICYSMMGGEYKYLTIMRRSSIGFSVLIAGNYKCTDKMYITRLLMNMTVNELALLESSTFAELWGIAYYHSKYKTQELESAMNKFNEKSFSESGHRYNIAEQKFNDLKKGIVLNNGNSFNLSSLIKLVKGNGWGGFTCHPMEFPKGRPCHNEILMNTAKREFCEEVGIPESMLPYRLSPYMYMESYKGLNNFTYINIYFTFKATPEIIRNISRNFIKTRSLGNPYGYETNSIMWLSKNEFKEFTEEYGERGHRNTILDELETFLKK